MSSPNWMEDAVKELQAKDLAERHEKMQRTLIEINTKVFEKAQAYTNVIILAGYAGSFTIWTYTKALLPNTANLYIALLLGFSLVTFVIWEISSMIRRSLSFVRVNKLLTTHKGPDDFFAKLRSAQDAEKLFQIRFMRSWVLVLVLTIVPALGSVGLLFYNYFALLFNLPVWPK